MARYAASIRSPLSAADTFGYLARFYAAQAWLRGPLRLADPLLRRGFRSVGERAAAGLAAIRHDIAAERPRPGP